MPPDLSLVVACYNEEGLLEDSMREVFRVLDAMRATYEVIFVDDCGQDRTSDVIDRIVAANPDRRLTKIQHEQNVGRGGTVTDGIRAAEGTYVGFLDIDLEVHARYIPSMVLALRDGHDVATAHRVYKVYLRSLYRHFLSSGYRWLMRKMLDVPLLDTETGFKFFRREAILPVLDATEDVGWFWDTEIMVRAHHAGLRIVEVPALFLRRFDKVSSVNTIRDSIDYLQKLWAFRKVARELRKARP